MPCLAKINAFFTVSRKEYLLSAVNEVGVPSALALIYLPFSSKFFLLMFAGLTVWWLGHFIGSHVNCLSDYEVDQHFKKHLPKAVDVLGEKNIKIIIVIETLLTTLFVLWLAYIFGRPLLMIFWLSGVALAFLYSVEPFRFKGRGLLNPLTLNVVLFVLPMFFIYHLFLEKFYLLPSLVLILFSIQDIPMYFIDEVSDYEEDKALEINNPCVLWGRAKVSLWAFIIFVFASILLLAVFVKWYPPQGILSGLIYLSVFAIFARIAYDYYYLTVLSRSFEKEKNRDLKDNLAKTIKREVKTPFYVIFTGVGVLLLTLILPHL